MTDVYEIFEYLKWQIRALSDIFNGALCENN